MSHIESPIRATHFVFLCTSSLVRGPILSIKPLFSARPTCLMFLPELTRVQILEMNTIFSIALNGPNCPSRSENLHAMRRHSQCHGVAHKSNQSAIHSLKTSNRGCAMTCRQSASLTSALELVLATHAVVTSFSQTTKFLKPSLRWA